MVFFHLQTRALLADLWMANINAAATPAKEQPISRWGEGPNRPTQNVLGAENREQSKRRHRRQPFPQAQCAAWVRRARHRSLGASARRLDEVRGDERDATAL